jgi:hypothetical protein
MLDQYRKTFRGTQMAIGVVTVFVQLRTHRLDVAFAFFAAMQLGALFGAFWAARLRRVRA